MGEAATVVVVLPRQHFQCCQKGDFQPFTCVWISNMGFFMRVHEGKKVQQCLLTTYLALYLGMDLPIAQF
jgi:hypothetical protein